MNRKIAITLAILVLANVFCGGTAPTPRPPQQPPTVSIVPADHNEQVVDGSQGTLPDGIPVDCGNTSLGNVKIPAGSFEGTETIEIDCLSPLEQSQLDQAVENATGQTGELLGAIKLNPSGMRFNSFVTITIPLLRRVDESAGDVVDVYVFQDDTTSIVETIQASVAIDCDRSCAKASVDHFTTFLAYKFGAPASGSCTDPLGCATYASGEPVRIASLLAFSSSDVASSAISADNEAGILGAIEAYGEILGHRIEYAAFDEACVPDQATESAKQIAQDPSFAGVVGTVCSASAEAALQILSPAGYSMVSTANTGIRLTLQGSHQDGYFRVAPSELYEAQAMATYAYQSQGYRTISIAYEGTENSKLLAETFQARFTELGGIIFSVDIYNDPSLYVERIKVQIAAGEQPDAIYMPMPGLGASFADLVTRFEYYGDSVALLGHSSMIYNDDFLKPAGNGKFYTHYPLFVPRLRDQAFDYGYDATALLLEAIRSAAQVDADGTLYIGRQALRNALSTIRGLPGRVGEHSCSPLGDCAATVMVEVYRYGEIPGQEFSYDFLYQTTIRP